MGIFHCHVSLPEGTVIFSFQPLNFRGVIFSPEKLKIEGWKIKRTFQMVPENQLPAIKFRGIFFSARKLTWQWNKKQAFEDVSPIQDSYFSNCHISFFGV